MNHAGIIKLHSLRQAFHTMNIFIILKITTKDQKYKNQEVYMS